MRGLETLALDPLALHLAGAADSLGGLAGAALGGLLIMAAELHLAEHAFALKLLLERLQRLIDVIITNENLHRGANSKKIAKTNADHDLKRPSPQSRGGYSTDSVLAKSFLLGQSCKYVHPEDCPHGPPGSARPR